MLPGFRLLFATVVLSAGVLIFGLGAAALLRAAHEEFITIPSWREAQKPIPQLPPLPPLAQATEAKPVLAMLRIEPSVSTPNEIALPDPPKLASITTGVATDAVISDAKPETKVETSTPVQPRVRRAARARLSASIRRQRAIARARAAHVAQIRLQQQQQQQFNADPFRFFLSPNPNGT